MYGAPNMMSSMFSKPGGMPGKQPMPSMPMASQPMPGMGQGMPQTQPMFQGGSQPQIKSQNPGMMNPNIMAMLNAVKGGVGTPIANTPAQNQTDTPFMQMNWQPGIR